MADDAILRIIVQDEGTVDASAGPPEAVVPASAPTLPYQRPTTQPAAAQQPAATRQPAQRSYDPYGEAAGRRESEIRREQINAAYDDLYASTERTKKTFDTILDVSMKLRGTLGGAFGPLVGSILDVFAAIRDSAPQARSAQRVEAERRNRELQSAPSAPIQRVSGGEVPQIAGVGADEDNVPVRATAGEFVVRKSEATKPENRAVLDRMNAGHYAAGGEIDREEQESRNYAGQMQAISALMMKGEKGVKVDSINANPPEGSSIGDLAAAIAYRESEEYERHFFIEHLGSTGEIKGAGTELLNKIIHKAAKKSYGIHLVSSPDSISYYEKMGFSQIGSSPEEMGLSSQSVKEKAKQNKDGKNKYAEGGNIAKPSDFMREPGESFGSSDSDFGEQAGPAGTHYARVGEGKGAFADANPDELESAHLYQNTPIMYRIQDHLRGGPLRKAWDAVTPEGRQAKSAIKGLDSLMDRQGLPQMTVYRAMVMDGADSTAPEPMESNVGTTITDKAYASTSTNPNAVEGFMTRADRVRAKIEVPEGAKGVPLSPKFTGLKTKWQNEDEILLPRDSHFHVNRVGLGKDRRWNADMDLEKMRNGGMVPHYDEGGEIDDFGENLFDTTVDDGLIEIAKRHFSDYEIGGSAQYKGRKVEFDFGSESRGQYLRPDFNFQGGGSSTNQNKEAKSDSFAFARKMMLLAKDLKESGYGIQAVGSDKKRSEVYENMLVNRIDMQKGDDQVYFNRGGSVTHYDDGGEIESVLPHSRKRARMRLDEMNELPSSQQRRSELDLESLSSVLPSREKEKELQDKPGWFKRMFMNLMTPADYREGYATGGDVTQNENFQKWFGDSKVVDEEGKPKTVYHGTNSEFDEFFSKDDWSFFSPSEDYAVNFGSKIISGNVAIKNPVDLRDISGIDDIEASTVRNRLLEYGIDVDENDFGQGEIHQVLEPVRYQIADQAKKLGFDGLFQKENYDGIESEAYVTFHPTQIKSTSNRGTYDPEDPHIHHAEGGNISAHSDVPMAADEVPIKATAGEFIVNKDAAQQNRPALEKMNAGLHYADGGSVGWQHMDAAGTPVPASAPTEAKGDPWSLEATQLRVLDAITKGSPSFYPSAGGSSESASPIPDTQIFGKYKPFADLFSKQNKAKEEITPYARPVEKADIAKLPTVKAAPEDPLMGMGETLEAVAGPVGAAIAVVGLIEKEKEKVIANMKALRDASMTGIRGAGEFAGFAADADANPGKSLQSVGESAKQVGLKLDEIVPGMGNFVAQVGEASSALGKLMDAINKTAERYGEYSPVIAQAQAISEVRQTMGDLRRAQESGPELVRYVQMQSELQQKFEDTKIKILLKILPIVTQIGNLVENVMPAGEGIANAIGLIATPFGALVAAINSLVRIQENANVPPLEDPTSVIFQTPPPQVGPAGPNNGPGFNVPNL